MPPYPATLDVGCGPKKCPGAWGIDLHPYDGVDQVVDLDHGPWPLPDGTFSRIIVSQVIEHVASIPDLLKELHRVASDGARIEICTPHFTNLDSWADPTHRWHLACGWHRPFTSADRYLSAQLPGFALAAQRISFRKDVLGRLGRCVVWLKGQEWWEEHCPWLFPGHTVFTELTVRKAPRPAP